jgi:hypothetical protein
VHGASPIISTLDNGVQKSTVSDPIKALLTEAGQDGHRLPIEIIWRKSSWAKSTGVPLRRIALLRENWCADASLGPPWCVKVRFPGPVVMASCGRSKD